MLPYVEKYLPIVSVAAATLATFAAFYFARRSQLEIQRARLQQLLQAKTADLERVKGDLQKRRDQLLAAAAAAQKAGLAPIPQIDLCSRPKEQIVRRIGQARAEWLQLTGGAKNATRTANALLVGQYVVGAAMATSFVQKTFNPSYIGFFGLVVVITTALRQQFHPEVRAKAAIDKANQLESLVRQSEDRIIVIETKAQDQLTASSQLLELLEHTTSELGRITSSTSLTEIVPPQRAS